MRLLELQDILIMGIGVLALLLWLALFAYSGKYKSLFAGLDEKQYPLCQIYSTGYALMELLHYRYKGRFDRKLRMELAILYDEKYVEYYLRLVYAQSISLAMLVLLFGFILYGLSQELLILIVMILMAGLCVYYFMTLSRTQIQKRSEELLDDFSEVVSKLALLTNAGMIMREAWSDVAYGSEGTIYSEMQRTCEDMNNGISEVEAIRRFGLRCLLPEIKKFATTIIQGIEKGNRELSMMLETQSDEIWEQKQQRVKRAGAKANTKLMVPMFIMFIGVLIMIIVPIFTNLGV